MKHDDLIKKLEDLDLSGVELPAHRHRLKMDLLNSGYWKGGKTGMSLLKKSAFAGSVIALVAVIAVVVINFTGTTQEVSAQEIAQNSYQAVVSLTPVEQHSLQNKLSIGDGPDELLKQAQDAEDLETLTYEEFISQYGEMMPPPLPDEEFPEIRSMKFLRFTDSDGLTYVLGISEDDNLPGFALAFGLFTDGDPDNMETHVSKSTVTICIDDVEGEMVITIDGKKYNLPAGTDPGNVEVIDGKVYINGEEVVTQE